MKKTKTTGLGITNKLFVLFFFFVFIFYGTLLVLFFHTKEMMAVSEQIVSKNNKVSALAKVVDEGLLNMEVNDKKYRLLNKEIYKEYFDKGQKDFESNLERILALETNEYKVAEGWKNLSKSYHQHVKNIPEIVNLADGEIQKWAPEDLADSWLEIISEARQANNEEVERSLVNINAIGKLSVKNGLIGMGITVVAGLIALLFISKSILLPLRELKHALTSFSSDKNFEEIKIKRKDEFGELASAFNDMGRQLKEEEELRSDFIATLSHEIRTPMSSIRESVNMILEGVLGKVNEKQTKFLEIAKSEITRINDLLNHLLQESHLETDSRRVTPVLIDPNKLVLEVSRGLIPSAKVKNVAMKLHKISKPPVVIGVKKELQQVLFNIIDNAIKFSPKGGEVDIELYLSDEKDMLYYQVTDQGPGITEQEQSLIFSKYYKAKNTRNHMDGVGLGLSISKRIIEFHGGEISVKNIEGKGCSFVISLPCEDANKEV